MNRVMERAQETDGVFAVMMIDLDKFKSINDRFGHDAGDAVLREFSRRLQENIRGVDLVARFGGEEFFVAMPDVDQRAAAHAAERIRRAIEDAPVPLPDGGEVEVTVSIGVAIATAADADAEAIIKRADCALYNSKEVGPQPGELLRPGGLRRRALRASAAGSTGAHTRRDVARGQRSPAPAGPWPRSAASASA